ncbi:MAG: DUF72 domain-containing protein [Gemmatimonadota bacterium]|nr:MAG: DUF72 domain-containing protein [Gemmatimonadota bacterium]
MARSRRSRIHVGTSGWTYDDWTGPFYPPEIKGAERLSFYAQRFDTVEVNATFYRLPFKGMITGWNRRLSESFHLVVKGSRLITHTRKLDDCGEPLARFLDRVLQLRRLQMILWQLPPSLRCDLGLLDRFLGELPNAVRHAVEFRHRTWWNHETAELLARHKAAFVAVSHPRLPDDIVPTTDVLYLRFHGLGPRLYDYAYSKNELQDWAAKVQPHLRGRELYAFFNNDYRARAPGDAAAFREVLEGEG